MKIRYLIIFTSFIILALLYSNRIIFINNEVNRIDYLDSLAKGLKKQTSKSKNIYYISNSDSLELYYQTRFVFVPHCIIKKKYSDIPKDSLFIIVYDKAFKNNTNIDSLLMINEGPLYSISNKLFSINLVKKNK